MNKSVIDVVNSYKSRTINTLRDQQISLTPVRDPYMIEARVTEYLYNSHRTLVNPYSLCLRCHYMYMRNLEPRKYMEHLVDRGPLEWFVNEGIIDPFMLFVDKKMVPWSMIEIIMSHEVYYIHVHTQDQHWINVLQNPNTFDVIHLPGHCIYTEGQTVDEQFRIFGFNIDGTFNDDNPVISISSNSPYMDFRSYYSPAVGINAFMINTDRTVKYYPQNVTLFRNGLLDTDTGASFQSTLLTIGDGTNPNGDELNFVVFSDDRTRDKVDNIAKAQLSYVKPFIEKQNAGQTIPSEIVQLEEEFDFEMSRKKDYQTNLDESINTIMNYSTELFEKAYLDNRHLFVEEKTGQWVIDNTRADGLLRIPRKHGDFVEEFILMLVNGELYKFFYMTKYYADYCDIPIKDIAADDTVDILRFTGINNNSFDIVVNANDEFKKYDENYLNDQMVLFSTIPGADHFTYPDDGLQHFPVDYTLEYDEEGKVKIYLTDPTYYGQKLKVVYKHQFRHYRFGIEQTSTESLAVDLGTKFMYCNDYHRYMIFHNGRRLGTDQYRLTLPVRNTTPFYRFELYLTIAVEEGDRVDVIYTPSLLKDIVSLEEIGTDGMIEVDKADITYSLNKNLMMLWVNGKKVPSSKIANIDSTHIRLIDDVESVKTVCLTKYIPDIDELTSVFHASNALWDQITAQLTDDELEAMLGYTWVELTDDQPWIYQDSIPVRSIMLELIREKYLKNPRVDSTGAFVYDYLDIDEYAVDGYDTSGNAILAGQDANETDYIDNIERYE